MKAKFGLAIASGLMCAAALAQAPAAVTPADTQAGAPLSPQTENGITYLCGGVGVQEAAQVKSEAPDYNLMLTFAENSGAYLANVGVEIADARGTSMLHTTCDAPIMLVNFPKPGNYRVTAEVNDHPVTKTVHIGKSNKHMALSMLWPRRQAESAGATG